MQMSRKSKTGKKYCTDFACILLSLCYSAKQAEVQGQIIIIIFNSN